MIMESSRSPHGIKQDDEWARFVGELAIAPLRPFEEHWERFQEIYRDREESDGPPLAWQPTYGQIARSNIGRLMQRLGFDTFAGISGSISPPHPRRRLMRHGGTRTLDLLVLRTIARY